MDAQQFLDEFGRDEAECIAIDAGTNFAYFYQIARGDRRPSVELASRLVESSGGRLDFVALLKSKKQSASAA